MYRFALKTTHIQFFPYFLRALLPNAHESLTCTLNKIIDVFDVIINNYWMRMNMI